MRDDTWAGTVETGSEDGTVSDVLAEDVHTGDMFAAVVQHLPAMVVVQDEAARVVYANRRFLATVRLPLETVVGRQLADLLDGLAPAGQHFVVHPFPVSLPGGPGRAGTVSVFMDATDAVHARQAAVEAEERHRAVADSIRIAIAVVDLDGRIQQVNPAFTHLLGRPQAQVRGKPLTSVLDHQVVLDTRDLWHELVAGRRRRYDTAAFARTVDGRSLPVELTVTLVRGVDGEPHSAVGLLNPAGQARLARPGERVELTVGEEDVLVGLAAGYTVPSLARRLHLTKRGVDYRIQCIRRKLRDDEAVPATIGALVARAYALGLLRADCWPPQLHERPAGHVTNSG